MKPRLGRYRLLKKLAQGGMAQVYLARQVGVDGFSKKVVIKRLPHAEGADDPGLLEMFQSEAALAAQLNHPNVVHVYDFAQAHGERFLVMEYVEGPSLKTLLKLAQKSNRLLPVEHCLKIASWVCEALAYTHALAHDRTGEPLNVVHRDITPDNILITRSGVVKLIDFGIARFATQVHKTSPGQVKGKMAYIAPEQLFNDAVDLRADLFSLGVVLYEALTSVQPFFRDNDAAIIDAILRHTVPPVTSLRPDAPGALDAIIAKATQKQRQDRYASALELQADLEAQLNLLMPGFTSARLRELVAELDPPAPADDEEETTTSDELRLQSADDDLANLAEAHTEPLLLPGHHRTRTSPRAAAPEPDEPTVAPADEPEPNTQSPPGLPAAPARGPPRPFPVVPLLSLMVGSAVAAWLVAMGLHYRRPEPTVVTHVLAAPRPEPAPRPAPVPEPPLPEPADADAGEVAVALAPAVATSALDAGLVSVTLESTPGATLWVDGAKAGETPLTLPLATGPHRLRFESPDAGLNKSVMLRVPAGESLSKSYAFEKVKLTLQAPQGAALYLGKKSLGTAPLPALELYEGTYRVRAVIDGQLDVTRTLELKAPEATEKLGIE